MLKLKKMFLARVVDNGPDKCWGWIGSFFEAGYTRVMCFQKTYLGHRVAFELFIRKLEPNEDVHHKCGNKGCVNPNHLQAVDSFTHNSFHKLRHVRNRKRSVHDISKVEHFT